MLVTRNTVLIVVALVGAAFGSIGCSPGLRGEAWTIECFVTPDADHRRDVESIANVLRQANGIRPADVRVQHAENASRIYYGTYYRKIDRAGGVREIPPQLRDDLALIKEMIDDYGRRVFIGARMVREAVPDVGPPEWDLANADGLYTLQVAAYEPTAEQPNFKQAAVDHATILRRAGYEAYYHHGPSSSEVTVGTFGADALILKPNSQPEYSPEVRALQRKERFRYNLTNGAIWHTIADGRKAPVASMLVRIPKRDPDQP